MARNGIKLGTALLRGLSRKCPSCGEACAFRGYLKVVDTCPRCDTPLSLYPTDDGPAYLTMLMVGHLVIAPAFMLGIIDLYSPSELAIAGVISMGVLTLALLPIVKGVFLGLLWYLGLKHAR
ncbi:DUF983 domain-containing protein [Asticcacaulis sp. AC402]|uniref:DUF983 domain-containing protein n=1 Tax=Asticcacaulis sp. AC402 TaxID=1282361 RepID=UPI0003C3E9A9|nr:DUF983 domain-containing protein [Asticcacaulis sp. AC402]ESQ76056.1 hypothetical protein ABAC402_06310 [Asticcacaulis sp. AC402]